MSKKTSMLALVIGGVVGTATTLLFARHNGATVRKRMQEHKEQGESAASVLWDEMVALKKELCTTSSKLLASPEVQDALDSAKVKLGEVYEEAKSRGGEVMEETQKQLQEYAKVAQEKATELGEEIKRRGGMAWEELKEGGKEVVEEVKQEVKKKTS